MGLFVSLFCVSFVVFAGLLWGLKLYARSYPSSFLQHHEKTIAGALYVAFFMGGALLSVFSVLPISVLAVWTLAGLAVLGLTLSSLSRRWKEFFSFLLCCVATLMLYQFSQNVIFWTLMVALIWWSLWHLLVWFDRFPLVSFLTSVSWAVALFAVGLVMHTVSGLLIVPAVLVGTSVAAISYFQLLQKQPILGHLAVSFSGFVLAGVWSYFLATGAVFQTITAFGYYLFEALALGMALYMHRPLQTFLSRLLSHPDLAPKAVRVVLSHLLILSFLSAMTLHLKWAVAPVLVFALVVVLVDLYLRLTALIHPQPTWRELLKNTKESFSLLSKQMKKKSFFKKSTSKRTHKKKRTPKK